MMEFLGSFALTNLATYGIPVLLLMTYVGSLGIPFPNSLLIIAAGAFAREGILNWKLALLACLTGAALADHSEYLLGRYAQGWLERHFGMKPIWKQSLRTFQRQGGWAILLTRFWLTPLAPAINIIAGGKYSYPRFLILDVLGQLLWVLLYGGLGFLFMEQWRQVSQAASGFSAASMVLAVGLFVLSVWRKEALTE